jgi:hypothetical protein
VLATIILLSIFTRAWPAELVDAIKHNAPHKYPWEHPETPSLDEEEPTTDLDNLDNEQLDLIDYPKDPDYNQAQP